MAHINVAITILEASGDPKGFPIYMDVYHLFKPGEIVTICKRALIDGPLDTRQLALAVRMAKALNPDDMVLAIDYVQTHPRAETAGQATEVDPKGRFKAALIWELLSEDANLIDRHIFKVASFDCNKFYHLQEKRHRIEALHLAFRAQPFDLPHMAQLA